MKSAKYVILIIITFSHISAALEILGCSSSREAWKCEIGKDCICLISGNCTNGTLLVYQEDIRSLVCAPQIIEGVARIDLELCDATYYKNLKVIADCDEGFSEEKSISLIAPRIETTSTTTSIEISRPRVSTTTIGCGLKGQYCGVGRAPCCEGLTCCPDYVCRESCESEGLKIDVWLIVIGAISVLIVVGILFFVGSIL
ncbi:MAG: hypothetical protein QXJ96_03010 [Candidatus Aenigmatarchaeota archaeon]|nr:hypothetical protein [Candidatus Aenigmarchaeota archaeon]